MNACLRVVLREVALAGTGECAWPTLKGGPQTGGLRGPEDHADRADRTNTNMHDVPFLQTLLLFARAIINIGVFIMTLLSL